MIIINCRVDLKQKKKDEMCIYLTCYVVLLKKIENHRKNICPKARL